jgi:hypothetical protein
MKEMWCTTDSSLFNKYYRRYLEHYGSNGVKCPICPPHGGENYNSNYGIRNWKKFRRMQQLWVNSRESLRDYNIPIDDDFDDEV